VTDINLPLQEVVVAADVLRQSEELLAGPLAPPADRQPDDSHHLHQEESAFQQAAAIPAGHLGITVNGHLEHGVALQQAETQVNNFGLWF